MICENQVENVNIYRKGLFHWYLDRDPASVERSNLLNITKLVIKELIDWSIRHGRSLESEHAPLQHFFIVLEHALRHGLKPKKVDYSHYISADINIIECSIRLPTSITLLVH